MCFRTLNISVNSLELPYISVQAGTMFSAEADNRAPEVRRLTWSLVTITTVNYYDTIHFIHVLLFVLVECGAVSLRLAALANVNPRMNTGSWLPPVVDMVEEFCRSGCSSYSSSSCLVCLFSFETFSSFSCCCCSDRVGATLRHFQSHPPSLRLRLSEVRTGTGRSPRNHREGLNFRYTNGTFISSIASTENGGGPTCARGCYSPQHRPCKCTVTQRSFSGQYLQNNVHYAPDQTLSK